MKDNLFNYGHLQHKNGLKLQLLIHLRWALLALLTVVLCVLMLVYEIDRTIFMYLCFIFLGLGIFNSYSLGRLNSSKSVSHWDLFINLFFDLCVITICLHLTGGIHNPFLAFIFIYIVLAGFLLSIRESILILVASLLSLVFLWLDPLPILIEKNIIFNPLSYLVGNSLVVISLWLLIVWVQNSFRVMDEKLMRVAKQLQQTDRLKALGLLSAGLSHELATPLNTILLKANRIKRKSNDELHDDIAILSEATKDCIRSLKRIQETSVSNKEINFEEVNVGDSIENIINFKKWKIPVDNQGQDFKYSLPLLGFSQIIVDLLENAVEASGEENVSVNILKKKNGLKINIINQNARIDDVVLKHFGEPFLTTKDTGTGLGLYNAKIFLESIGAKIFLSNRELSVCVEIELAQEILL